MIESYSINRQIKEINKHTPRIAKMLCSGDKEQIYQAKKEGDKFFTVIVEPHQMRNPWKWTIEIITRAYAGEKKVMYHFLTAIEASEWATLRGEPKAVGKPKTVGLEHYPYEHEYQWYVLKMSVRKPKLIHKEQP